MPITPWVPTVKLIQDGQEVSQSVVNVPLEQLIQREQHLYDAFDALQNKSALMSFNQPIHPADLTGSSPIQAGQLAVVYYRDDNGGSGLSRASTGFSTSPTNSMFQPNNSNYIFGIIRNINPGNLADCYIQGMCDFSIPIDDPYSGLIEYSLDQYGNRIKPTFNVGPYYVSRKMPGKLTQNPDGLPVYVGYAVSPTKFFLQPSVDEFTQFFINYRYNILDRPVYPPVLSNDGTTWSIPTPNGSPNNPNRLGWIAATSDNLPGYTIPTSPSGQVAKFLYYIPSNLTSGPDSTILNSNEIAEAIELGGNLPPVPSNFVQILANGIVQRYADVNSPDGIFSIDNYGIWWFSNQANTQPWADDILTASPGGTWDPTAWETYKGSNFRRPRLFISFAKFNPALRTQLVSSVNPYNITANPPTGTQPNNSSNFISFQLKNKPGESSTTGDLLVNVTPKFIKRGYSDLPEIASATWSAGIPSVITFASPHGLNSSTSITLSGFYDVNNSWNSVFSATITSTTQVSIVGPTANPIVIGTAAISNNATSVPVSSSVNSTYTAGSAIADLTWDNIQGKFTKKVTPVVAKLVGTGGINVSPVSGSPGAYNVSYLSGGAYGLVDSIEPVNSRLEFRGLNSYIKFPYNNPVTVPYGLIGKIVLTKDAFNNAPLNLVLQVFGNTPYNANSTNTNLAITFEYSATSAQNGSASPSTLGINNTVGLTSFSSSRVILSMPTGGYTAYTPINLTGGLTIPSQYIGKDTVVNFKLTRTLTGSANDYTGDVGILGIYWGITNS